MHNYRIVWEDEAQAREIELFADYSVEAGVVEVQALRATRVTFYDADSKQVSRRLRVHTNAGSDLLAKQYLAAREEAMTLVDEIRSQIELKDENLAAKVSE